MHDNFGHCTIFYISLRGIYFYRHGNETKFQTKAQRKIINDVKEIEF